MSYSGFLQGLWQAFHGCPPGARLPRESSCPPIRWRNYSRDKECLPHGEKRGGLFRTGDKGLPPCRKLRRERGISHKPFFEPRNSPRRIDNMSRSGGAAQAGKNRNPDTGISPSAEDGACGDQAETSADFPRAVSTIGATGRAPAPWVLAEVTSDFPIKVAPSSITMRMAFKSPFNWELAFSSQRSLTEMFPLTVPWTVTALVLTSPLTCAFFPSVRTPSEMISPSSLPSKINSLSNFNVPEISTSFARMFFAEEGSAANEVKLFKFITVGPDHSSPGAEVNAAQEKPSFRNLPNSPLDQSRANPSMGTWTFPTGRFTSIAN